MITQEKIEKRKEHIYDFFQKSKSEIAEICNYLECEFEKSEMAIKHPNLILFYDVNTQESLKQFKIIYLYSLVLSIDYRYSEPYEIFIEKNFLKSIGKSESSKENFKNYYIENLNKILESEKLINEISFPYTSDELISDFKNDRTIVKTIFKNIFEMYNITFPPTALKILFSKTEYENKSNFDFIELVTYKTRFCGGLASQFFIDKSMKYAGGIFSIFFMRSASLLSVNDNFKISDEEKENHKNIFINNPFILEKSVIEIFAKTILLSTKINSLE